VFHYQQICPIDGPTSRRDTPEGTTFLTFRGKGAISTLLSATGAIMISI
jgi:hypothetical protein